MATETDLSNADSLTGQVDVLLVDDDRQWTRVTARLLEADDSALDVTAAHSLAAGREQFTDLDPDCVVCDYQLGDGTGLDLLETVRDVDATRPFVLVTGRGDESVASEAIGQGVTDYIPKDHDDVDSTLLRNRVTNAINTAQVRNQLDRERRGKAAMLDVLRSTSHEADLSTEFCRVLVEDHGYAGAWIGSLETDEHRGVVPQAVEGCDVYLDAIASSGLVPTESPDPAISAATQDEPVEVSVDDGDDWEAIATDHGFDIGVGMPITHDGIRLGVLGVYLAGDGPPLDDRRRDVLEEYADIVGYAHQTAELKRSLFAQQSLSVDIEIADTTAPLAELTAQVDETDSVDVLSTIQRDDGTLLYLTAFAGLEAETLRTAVASCESIRLETTTETGDGVRCDLYSTGQTPEHVLTAHGASIDRIDSADGTVTITVSVADRTMLSSLTEALRDEYDEVTVTTLWNDDPDQVAETGDPLGELTDKQRSVLRHAYFDGYFELPRDVSATELAEKFDIARATLTQHMRTAQRKVFEHVFETNDSN